MGDTWVTDITHFEGLPPHLAEGPAGRIARFFSSIVSAASVFPAEIWVDSTIWCRRRPGRKRCPGHIRLCYEEASGPVKWHCTSCDDQGTISNWKGTSWDLNRWARDPWTRHKLYEIVLTREELHELRNNLTFDPESEGLIYGATVTDRGIVMRATEEELDNLQGFIAAESNHEENRRRRNILDRIYDKIQPLLERLSGDNTGAGEQEGIQLPQLSSGVLKYLDELEKRLREGRNNSE